MKVDDDELDEVLFLDRHPAWTYAAMAAAPDDVIEALKMIDFERSRVKR